ncbi:OprD family outer membrane porin [Sulfurimonas sp.]
MKKITLLITILLFNTATILVANDFVDDTKVTADLRAFYFNGDRDNRTDREAFAVGGILKYESGSYNGLKIGSAYYLSHDLLSLGEQTAQKGSIANGGSANIVTADVAGNSELVKIDGSTINTIGEAYIQYTLSNTTFKLGRQRLDTPLVNDYYNRFLPNSYEALFVSNKDLADTELQAAYIYKWKYKASEKFIDILDAYNPIVDRDELMFGMVNKSIQNTKLQLYLYLLRDIANTAYFQLDNSKITDISGIKLFGSLQYLKQKYDGDALYGYINTYLAGAKLGAKLGSFTLTTMYDQVGDDTIIGSGTSYSSLGHSSFINFTDIQIDGEALNAGAISYGGIVGYKFNNRLKSELKYVHIEQDLLKQSNSIPSTANTRPSSNEFNIDIKYKIDELSKVRIRFANIDYESTHKNEFDENNIRIIYDYRFIFSK